MSIDPPKLPDSDVYKTLLESTKAIPWRIDWQTMTFSYIGPQIEALLGWTPQSWVSVDDWVERMHPDDREYVVNFCVSQSRAGVDHEADYRALTASGDYVWIRDVVHVVRNGDEVEALIGFMFDISERKKTEEHLIRLQKQLEEYSFQDGLTGIAHLRAVIAPETREWANQTADLLLTRSPLAMAVTLEMLRRGRELPLEQCFALELHLDRQWFDRGDLMEGVRALIIDKDKNPRWNPPTLDALDPAHVASFFTEFNARGASITPQFK